MLTIKITPFVDKIFQDLIKSTQWERVFLKLWYQYIIKLLGGEVSELHPQIVWIFRLEWKKLAKKWDPNHHPTPMLKQMKLNLW